MTTALYARVSTLSQDTGLASQEQAITQFCEGHKIVDGQWYRDTCTGANLDRPAFAQLQADIFAGKIDRVIVWKIDRISRSLKDGINVISDWLDRGIAVVSVSQQMDWHGSVGKMVLGIFLAIAEMERQNISENIQRGLDVKRKVHCPSCGTRNQPVTRDPDAGVAKYVCVACGATWDGCCWRGGRRLPITKLRPDLLSVIRAAAESGQKIGRIASTYSLSRWQVQQALAGRYG